LPHIATNHPALTSIAGILRLLQLPAETSEETELWRRSGEQGDDWIDSRRISIPVTGSYQVLCIMQLRSTIVLHFGKSALAKPTR